MQKKSDSESLAGILQRKIILRCIRCLSGVQGNRDAMGNALIHSHLSPAHTRDKHKGGKRTRSQISSYLLWR